MLSMLNSVTVLLGKHDEHDYRGAGMDMPPPAWRVNPDGDDDCADWSA
jgi:hypothetical protein